MEKIILLLILCVHPSSHYHLRHALSPLDISRLIYISRPLTIGQRVDGFVSVDKPARYYITLNESVSSVTIRVTPCESPLFWSLSVLTTHSLPPLAKDGSEDLSGGIVKHQDSRLFDHWDPQKLFSFQGNGEESFSVTMTPGGFYFLDLVSLETDTNFHVFVWDSKSQANPWPQLPTDPRVDIVSIEENSARLSWKPSLGPSDGSEVEFCVFINKHHNFKTLCATELNTGLNTKRQSQPNWNGQDEDLNKLIHFAKKKSKYKDLTSLMVSKSQNAKSPSMLGVSSNKLWFSKNGSGGQRFCVKDWANVTISGLKPKTLYYFDVFAVSPKHGTSVAYTGTFAETKTKHKSLIPNLPSEEMVNIFLKSRRVRVFNVDPPASGYKWLFVHSCLHKVHLQINTNGKNIVSQSLQGAHNFKLTENADKYIITIKSSRGGPGLVKLYTTNSHNHLPFPSLPSDISVSVSKRSCSSARVTWAGSGKGVKYCIYARHLEQNLDLKLIHKHQNSCLSTSARSKAEKVLCRQGALETFMEEQITNLKPGKVYLVDVYFQGHYNTTIKFPSLVVKTQEHCT
ncbi:protein NDNF-like [Spea bombifrons]|uniref:protein NDNF-like n=1 Tax=Spea bombifrons TaxID=233779 RepID=UPI00234AC0F3|nr:protein NDNF-like [Spea bombifrons]